MISEGTREARYKIANVEPILRTKDVQARVFTLAPGEAIPWHFHKESTDYYFVLEGTLSVSMDAPSSKSNIVSVGGRHKIDPGTPHEIANMSDRVCRFLLLQGVGRYDFIRVVEHSR